MDNESIEKIKNIFTSLGINLAETQSEVNLNGYSIKLEDKNYGLTIYGKGSTIDSCRADAYFKAIANLQNMRLPSPFIEALKGGGRHSDLSRIYPDAYALMIRRTAIPNELLQDMYASFYHSEGFWPDKREMLDKWVDWNESMYFSYPIFYSVKRKKKINLPHKIIDILSASHGVCVASTYEEALCQALHAEIKRHVQRIGNGEIPSWIDREDNDWFPAALQLYKHFTNFEQRLKGLDIEARLRALIKAGMAVSSDIYIRFNGFLGIPSVCVYLAGVTFTLKERMFQSEPEVEMEANLMIPFLPLYDVDFWSGYSFELLALYEEQYSMLFADFCSASTNELNAIFYIYIGDNTSALNELYKEKHPHKHIQAAICELELRIKGVCTTERDQMLRMFFGKRYVAYIQRNWRDRNTHTHPSLDKFMIKQKKNNPMNSSGWTNTNLC